MEKNDDEIGKFQSSYSVLIEEFGNPYGILFFPYFEDVSFSENELNTFLQSLYKIYLIMLLVAIVLAYFISKYISRSLETIRMKIDQLSIAHDSSDKTHANGRFLRTGGPKAFFKAPWTWNFDLGRIFEIIPRAPRDFVAGELLACKFLWTAQGTSGGFSARLQYSYGTC